MLIHPRFIVQRGSALALVATCAFATPSIAEDDTAALRAAITSLKAENAELAKLVGYADVLRDLSSNDPASARAARAPIERCLNTPLRAYCHLLRGLFKTEPAQ